VKHARWLLRRLALSALVVLGAATTAFCALRLAPGDPVTVMVGMAAAQDDSVVEQVRHNLGFDRPFLEQYALFLGRLLRGDLGYSYQLDEPVSRLLREGLLPTVELASAGFALALVVGLLLAVATAGRRPFLRRLSAGFELLMISVPGFWVGLLLLAFFSFRLDLFPAIGGSGLNGLVLPAVTLALSLVGVYAQVLRDGLTRALDEPFVLSSRARGTGETAVRWRHALRHALISIITISGWTLGAMLGGTVIIETIFSRPGLGRTLATAIENRDFPVVTGLVVVSGTVFALINLAVDLLYRWVDPRLREVKL
jgi:peptide/nickel transport system permease protein